MKADIFTLSVVYEFSVFKRLASFRFSVECFTADQNLRGFSLKDFKIL